MAGGGQISARIGLKSIFFVMVMTELELGERVEMYDGYVGESPYVTKVPSVIFGRDRCYEKVVAEVAQDCEGSSQELLGP